MKCDICHHSIESDLFYRIVAMGQDLPTDKTQEWICQECYDKLKHLITLNKLI